MQYTYIYCVYQSNHRGDHKWRPCCQTSKTNYCILPMSRAGYRLMPYHDERSMIRMIRTGNQDILIHAVTNATVYVSLRLEHRVSKCPSQCLFKWERQGAQVLRTSYIDLRTSYIDLRTSYIDLRTSYIDLRASYIDLRTSYIDSVTWRKSPSIRQRWCKRLSVNKPRTDTFTHTHIVDACFFQ